MRVVADERTGQVNMKALAAEGITMTTLLRYTTWQVHHQRKSHGNLTTHLASAVLPVSAAY